MPSVEAKRHHVASLVGVNRLTGDVSTYDVSTTVSYHAGMGKSKIPPAKQAELVERRAKVAEMHRKGMTFATIGQQLGIDRTLAHKDWQAWMRSLDPVPDREERRAGIREQISTIVEQAALDVQRARSLRRDLEKAGDVDGVVKADAMAGRWVNTVLKGVGDLRALDGLDAPKAVDVTSGGVPVGGGVLDRLEVLLGGVEVSDEES